MYLKSLTLINFRKFRESSNKVELTAKELSTKTNENDKYNIASSVTLLVGKNNAGKTTIIQALDKLVNNNDKFGINDFNINFLKELTDNYNNDNFDVLPFIEFKIEIGLDIGENDYLTNLIPFLTIGNVNSKISEIIIKYELVDEQPFRECLKSRFNQENETFVLSEIIEENISLFKLNYYNNNNQKVEQFRLSNLIEFVPVMVTDIENGNGLSTVFNRIIKSHYNNFSPNKKKDLDSKLININTNLTNDINTNYSNKLNNVIDKIVSSKKVQTFLSANITFKKILDNLIRYEFIENDNRIPENQFGLGYSNLLMIIARIMDYIEKYPNDSFNSKINIISIEEPETHMHPQMQEMFIKYVDDAINLLLSNNGKCCNTQIIITTHSPHIVNGKVQTGESFDNINYISEINGGSSSVFLNDNIVKPEGDLALEELKFIKKHFKFGTF